MRTVLAYDIVDDRRRGRFYRRLRRLLLPMQKSVFEGDLTPAALAAVQRLIHKELNPQEDAVRVYSLCKACQARVQSHGPLPEYRDPDDPVLIL